MWNQTLLQGCFVFVICLQSISPSTFKYTNLLHPFLAPCNQDLSILYYSLGQLFVLFQSYGQFQMKKGLENSKKGSRESASYFFFARLVGGAESFTLPVF